MKYGRIIIGAAAVLLVAIGYLVYTAVDKRAQQRAVAGLVRDTTGRLAEALAGTPTPELLAAIDANLQALEAPRDPSLAELARSYVVSAREIAHHRIEAERLARDAQASRQVLAAHMAQASRRNEAWIRDAVTLKKRADADQAALAASRKALDDFLFELPDLEKRLAPRVGGELPLDRGSIAAARKRLNSEPGT